METLQLIVLILHVLVACLLVGMAFFVLMFVAKKVLTPGDVAGARKVSSYGIHLTGTQLLLGLALVGMEPDKFGRSPLVWTKLVLLIVAGVLAVVVVNRKLKVLAATGTDARMEKTIRMAAVGLLVLLVVIVALGVIVTETTP